MSRAGKATGKYKNCFNIERDDDGSVEWMNFDGVECVEIIPESEDRIVMFNSDETSKAKESEIQNWIRNQVYEEVDDLGQDSMSVRWVITEKMKNNEIITKARLVARGFEEDTVRIQKDSPTCSKESVRLALSIAASKQWPVNSVDIKAA